MECWLGRLFMLIYMSQHVPSYGAKIYPVVEEQPAGTFVADAKEQLPKNLTSKPDLKFGFLRGYDKKALFHINDTSGQITTASKLDRETLCPREERNCYFDIPVITVPLHQFQIIPIKVELLDINDNSPVFAQRELLLEIAENQPIGAKFQLPSAQDADQIDTKASQIEYSLKSSSTGKDIPFVIINSPNAETQDVYLQLIAPLDRETKDFYAFSILAKDQGNPALVGSIDVVIQVLDSNDHAPVFTETSYEVRVQENIPRGSPVLTVQATDGDAGRNAELSYSISPSTSKLVRDIFDIDSDTGQVHVKSELDREVKDVHKIFITARDKATGTALETSVLATVLVEDLNDNPPLIDVSYFPQEASAALIAEDAPIGTFVALVRLKDADADANGRAVCLLQSDTFQLKQQSEDTYAIITSKLLDREKREEYLLELTAKDQGKPSLESRTTLQIVVGDVNDSPPIFDRSVYNVKVKENSALGMEIIQFRVTDKDSAPESQGVSYRLSDHSALFNLDEKRGILQIQSQLDRETHGNSIHFTVEAFDPTNLGLLKSQVPVIVELIDENDNTPEWEASAYEFDITTDLRRGSLVGRVRATDRDFGPNGMVTYLLNNSDFLVNSTTGELTAAHDIFVQDSRQIRMDIMAQDNGEHKRTASAQLFITISNATSNQLTHTRRSSSLMDFLFNSSTGLPIIIALIVVSLLLLCGAVVCAMVYRNKSKENHSYNVRIETARVFQRGSKSQLAGDGSGTQSDTDSCHRRSVESEEKYARWVFGPTSQTPPVSSSTKSSRCSSANTNRNSLLNDYGKVPSGPIIYDIVNEEAPTSPAKSIQTFQLANQLQKTLDRADNNAGGHGGAGSSEEDDDGGFKRHTGCVRAMSFYQSARQHPLTHSTAHALRSASSAAGYDQRIGSPGHSTSMTLPHRGSVRRATTTLAQPGFPGPESGYSSTVSTASFAPYTIRTNPCDDNSGQPIRSPLSQLTKYCIERLDATQMAYVSNNSTAVPFTVTGIMGTCDGQSKPTTANSVDSPFSSSLNMSLNSGNTSSLGAGLEFDEFLPSTLGSPFFATNNLPKPAYDSFVEYHTPC